jgi:hypothetical protein
MLMIAHFNIFNADIFPVQTFPTSTSLIKLITVIVMSSCFRESVAQLRVSEYHPQQLNVTPKCAYAVYDLHIPAFDQSSLNPAVTIMSDSIRKVVDDITDLDEEDFLTYANELPCDSSMLQDPDQFGSEYHINANTPQLFSLDFSLGYDFGGGGHGFGTHFSAFSIDLKEKSFISLTDMFRPGFADIIRDSLTHAHNETWFYLNQLKEADTLDILGCLEEEGQQWICYKGFTWNGDGVTLYYERDLGSGNAIDTFFIDWSAAEHYVNDKYRKTVRKWIRQHGTLEPGEDAHKEFLAEVLFIFFMNVN